MPPKRRSAGVGSDKRGSAHFSGGAGTRSKSGSRKKAKPRTKSGILGPSASPKKRKKKARTLVQGAAATAAAKGTGARKPLSFLGRKVSDKVKRDAARGRGKRAEHTGEQMRGRQTPTRELLETMPPVMPTAIRESSPTHPTPSPPPLPTPPPQVAVKAVAAGAAMFQPLDSLPPALPPANSAASSAGPSPLQATPSGADSRADAGWERADAGVEHSTLSPERAGSDRVEESLSADSATGINLGGGDSAESAAKVANGPAGSSGLGARLPERDRLATRMARVATVDSVGSVDDRALLGGVVERPRTGDVLAGVVVQGATVVGQKSSSPPPEEATGADKLAHAQAGQDDVGPLGLELGGLGAGSGVLYAHVDLQQSELTDELRFSSDEDNAEDKDTQRRERRGSAAHLNGGPESSTRTERSSPPPDGLRVSDDSEDGLDRDVELMRQESSWVGPGYLAAVAGHEEEQAVPRGGMLRYARKKGRGRAKQQCCRFFRRRAPGVMCPGSCWSILHLWALFVLMQALYTCDVLTDALLAWRAINTQPPFDLTKCDITLPAYLCAGLAALGVLLLLAKLWHVLWTWHGFTQLRVIATVRKQADQFFLANLLLVDAPQFCVQLVLLDATGGFRSWLQLAALQTTAWRPFRLLVALLLARGCCGRCASVVRSVEKDVRRKLPELVRRKDRSWLRTWLLMVGVLLTVVFVLGSSAVFVASPVALLSSRAAPNRTPPLQLSVRPLPAAAAAALHGAAPPLLHDLLTGATPRLAWHTAFSADRPPAGCPQQGGQTVEVQEAWVELSLPGGPSGGFSSARQTQYVFVFPFITTFRFPTLSINITVAARVGGVGGQRVLGSCSALTVPWPRDVSRSLRLLPLTHSLPGSGPDPADWARAACAVRLAPLVCQQSWELRLAWPSARGQRGVEALSGPTCSVPGLQYLLVPLGVAVLVGSLAMLITMVALRCAGSSELGRSSSAVV